MFPSLALFQLQTMNVRHNPVSHIQEIPHSKSTTSSTGKGSALMDIEVPTTTLAEGSMSEQADD